LEAIRRAGCRAIIQHGWSGLAKGRALPENVMSIGFVQHTWLFPHAACVVGAGGSGTPATTLRSGVPAIFVPHVNDQPMWAELVRGLGCATHVIPYSDLTAERLAEAIKATLVDSELHKRAADFALKIRAEQGVSRARVLVEQLHSGLKSTFAEDDNAVNMRKALQQRLRARKIQPAAITD
jgi:UDP:flavonoid glycosyltransferase YjiC (YdhE family)